MIINPNPSYPFGRLVNELTYSKVQIHGKLLREAVIKQKKPINGSKSVINAAVNGNSYAGQLSGFEVNFIQTAKSSAKADAANAYNQVFSDSGDNVVGAYKVDFQNGTLPEIVRR